MRNLTDYIEDYLKELIERANRGIVEIQRRELAEMFECVPSQINYVLSTRFTPDRGYLVESRRGGGGYIRIIKVELVHEEKNVWTLIEDTVGDEISQRRMESILVRLEEAELLTYQEASLIKTVIERELSDISQSSQDVVRAKLLKAILLVLFGRAS
jgi:transcriptional regulator CtsR